MKTATKWLFIIIFFLALSPIHASAHGIGQSLEKEVGGYLVDVGYDAFALREGEQVNFDFSIFTKDRAESPDFTDAWVRIVSLSGFNLGFAGYLAKPEFGPIRMTYAFPKGGTYNLIVSFQKNGEKITDKVSFPLTIEPKQGEIKSQYSMLLTGAFLGALLGVSLTLFLKRRR